MSPSCCYLSLVWPWRKRLDFSLLTQSQRDPRTSPRAAAGQLEGSFCPSLGQDFPICPRGRTWREGRETTEASPRKGPERGWFFSPAGGPSSPAQCWLCLFPERMCMQTPCSHAHAYAQAARPHLYTHIQVCSWPLHTCLWLGTFRPSSTQGCISLDFQTLPDAHKQKEPRKPICPHTAYWSPTGHAFIQCIFVEQHCLGTRDTAAEIKS